MLQILCVAGTDTEVGKTYVAARLARDLRRRGVAVGVYKPVASGCIRRHAELSEKDQSLKKATVPKRAVPKAGGDEPELLSLDAVRLWEAAGQPLTLSAVCPQCFEAPLAPPQAAKQAGKTVDVDALYGGASRWVGHCDQLIIEGAGGLFSPLADGVLNIDLFRRWPDAQIVLVAANRLGAIHQVIASVRAAEHAGLAIERVILSSASPHGDASTPTNAQQIRRYCPGQLVTELAWGE
ncbi:dethiobiotin synthase [Roseiconus nitratireducens]|uniref:ATP-dependent dethiobiotin synthetase BioD n=1 Tax=Roseiconus nitratireducens TaxID=2605748 RepID=A0A5M6DL23_9BACT|nr:dethiobiotin synthase [Roseiconus nitratireducens]KAA5546045.1 dethiobiotin synthase [Roseiconus nitratireducens]